MKINNSPKNQYFVFTENIDKEAGYPVFCEKAQNETQVRRQIEKARGLGIPLHRLTIETKFYVSEFLNAEEWSAQELHRKETRAFRKLQKEAKNS